MKKIFALLFALTLLLTFSCKSDLDKTIEKEVEKEEIIKTDVIITWDIPNDIVVGTELSETQLNATADVSGTFIYTPEIGTVLSEGTHDLTVNFTPNDTENYNTASETISITVINLNIGDSYQGGLVAYIYQDDDPGFILGEIHGLIASNEDLTVNESISTFTWYNGNMFSTNVIGTELGTGLTNTNSIVSAQGVGTYAAKICVDYVYDDYDDWYLPSTIELIKVYESGELTIAYDYWTSTEYENGNPAYENDNAYVVDLGGTLITKPKSVNLKVRAIRYF